MTAFEIVLMNVCCNCLSGFFDIVPFCQIGFIIFEGTEPPLDHDVVSPAALAVHALTNTVFLEKAFVFVAGELTALIRIEDFRLGNLECLLTGINTCSSIKRIIQFPSDNASAVPINDGCQIQKATFDRDIGDINGPGLIWTVDYRIRAGKEPRPPFADT